MSKKSLFLTLLVLLSCARSRSFQFQLGYPISLRCCRGNPNAVRFNNGRSSICAPIRPARVANRARSELLSIPLALQVLSDNQWGLYAVIATSAATALRLERTTSFGKNLSGPVTAMLISAILTNIGVLPAEGSIHLVNLQMFVLKLATPMLLFGADLRKIFRETGVMLKAFLLGTFGTLLGSFLGMLLLAGPLNSIGIPGDGWKIASALTAKNIGGGLNFFSVADVLGVSSSALSTGLAVDNLLGLLYFPFISWCGAPYDENIKSPGVDFMKMEKGNLSLLVSEAVADDVIISYSDKDENVDIDVKESEGEDMMEIVEKKENEEEERQIQDDVSALLYSNSDTKSNILIIDKNINTNNDDYIISNSIIEGQVEVDDIEKLTTALAVAFTIATLADYLSKLSNLPSIPISTFLTVLLATFFPKNLKTTIPSGELLGKLFLLFFFASVGNASGTISSTFAAKGAASLLLFEIVLYFVHLSVLISVGRKVFNIPIPDLLLASNANIGNAATASSLATAKGWKSRILPAILVGTLGNAFGTFAGLSLGSFVLKKIAGF